jgi:hypothetical protein
VFDVARVVFGLDYFGTAVGGASSKQGGVGSRTEEIGSERGERRGRVRVSERQLVVCLFNGAMNVREAQGTRAQDQVQESEKERPDDGLREPGVRHALAADAGRARSRAAGHRPRPAATAARSRALPPLRAQSGRYYPSAGQLQLGLERA